MSCHLEILLGGFGWRNFEYSQRLHFGHSGFHEELKQEEKRMKKKRVGSSADNDGLFLGIHLYVW